MPRQFCGPIRMGSSPWIALVGGVRWSLGLGRWGHRWWVVGGSASWRCIGGSAGCCLRGYGGWRRSCWGLGLCLGLQRGLRGLLGLEGGEREMPQRSICNNRPHICSSGVQSVALRGAAYKDGPGCRRRASSGGRRGALIGRDIKGWSAGLAGDALLQLP